MYGAGCRLLHNSTMPSHVPPPPPIESSPPCEAIISSIRSTVKVCSTLDVNNDSLVAETASSLHRKVLDLIAASPPKFLPLKWQRTPPTLSDVAASIKAKEAGLWIPKLIICDLNGLFVYRQRNFSSKDSAAAKKALEKYGAADIIRNKEGRILYYVWKRPHYRSILSFMRHNFAVGVWSSAQMSNVSELVNFVFEDSRVADGRGDDEGKDGLAFIVDQKLCREVGKMEDNPMKPKFLKETKLIGSNVVYSHGIYSEKENILLLDDSPYKAARNPANTSFHPTEWTPETVNDSELSEGGGIYTVISGLRAAPRVSDYIKGLPSGTSLPQSLPPPAPPLGADTVPPVPYTTETIEEAISNLKLSG
jgi:hypothetical protein